MATVLLRAAMTSRVKSVLLAPFAAIPMAMVQLDVFLDIFSAAPIRQPLMVCAPRVQMANPYALQTYALLLVGRVQFGAMLAMELQLAFHHFARGGLHDKASGGVCLTCSNGFVASRIHVMT
jgi:hypothetical protein